MKINLFVEIELYWYLFVLVVTEVLSYLYILNGKSIKIAYFFFIAFILIKYGSEIVKKLKSKKRIIITDIFLLLFFILTFIQGLFSAPNTTDSLVYHIPRVAYWIQNMTVFQSNIHTLHDFMPPFAEYLLTNLYLLAGNDRLLFMSQWISYLSVVMVSGLIVKVLKASKKIKNLIMLLVATTPILVLQAASTQTDLLVLNFILIALYIVIVDAGNNVYKNILLLAVATGLGIMVKPNSILFNTIPAGLLIYLSRKNIFKIFKSILIVLPVILLILFPYFKQNQHLYGNILGQNILDKNNSYVNNVFTIQSTTSNFIRNLSLNTPVPIFYEKISVLIIDLHNKLGISVNDPRTTYEGSSFSPVKYIYPQEDVAANPIHILIIVAPFLLAWKLLKWDKSLLSIFILNWSSFVLFSFALKWQPYNIRLEMPFIIIGTIIGILFIANSKVGYKIILFFAVLSTPLAYALIFLNISKPYVPYDLFIDKIKPVIPNIKYTPKTFYGQSRESQYFTPRQYWQDPYKSIVMNFSQNSVQYKISFDLMDGFEYPLWVLLWNNNIRFYVRTLNEIDKDTYIISTSSNKFNDKRYNTICYKTNINYGYACLSKYK